MLNWVKTIFSPAHKAINTSKETISASAVSILKETLSKSSTIKNRGDELFKIGEICGDIAYFEALMRGSSIGMMWPVGFEGCFESLRKEQVLGIFIGGC